MDSNEKTTSIEDKHQLAWSQEIPNYGNKLLKRLDEFRKTTILYDVQVRAQGGEFNAHKVILAACGGIFRTYFVDEKKKMISSDITELSLDCPAQGLKPIIRFAYTGALVVTKRNAVATMIAAEVTKMKEVQEICAGIAVKEYGWIIHFEGEKDATTIENLGKVLQMHVACFTASCSNGSHVTDCEDDLPFTEEVDQEFPDHMTTYQRLAITLKSAESLVKTTKLKSKQSAEQKPDIAETIKDMPAIKAAESVNSKPPVPNARSVKPKSDEVDGVKDVADDDKTNLIAPVTKEKTPKKPVTSPTDKAPDSVNPEPPLPPSGSSVKSKSDEVRDVKIIDDDNKVNLPPPVPNERTPKKPVAPPSPKVKAPELRPSPRPPSGGHKKSKSDEVGDVKIIAGDEEVNLPPSIPNEKTPMKPAAPPSFKGKAPESANSKPPRPPSGGHKNSTSDEIGDIKIIAGNGKAHLPPPVSNEKTTRKPAAPPSLKVKSLESANPKPPRPPSGGRKNSKSDEIGDVKVIAGDDKVHVPPPVPNEKTTRKPAAPPSLKVKSLESANPKPPRPPSGGRKHSKSDEIGDVKIIAGDGKVHVPTPVPNEKTPKKPVAPPSPKVKTLLESVNPKPPRPPNGEHKNSKADELGDVKMVPADEKLHLPPPVPNEKTPRKPVAPIPPSLKVKAPESPTPKPSRPPTVSHKKSKSDESEAIESNNAHVTPISSDQAPKKRSPPPTPKSKPPEPAIPRPPIPNGAPKKTAPNAEKDGVKIIPTNKENDPAAPLSTEGIPKNQASSPRVKPRNSLKSKKSVPAPPPPSTADKSPKAAAPPRPTKAPAKVPPPRPKPPAAKKNSLPNDQGGSPTKKAVAENYDDKLNPFA